MINIQLNKNHNETFLYKALYNEIKDLILSQKIQKHEKLPSKRQLATQLKTSVNTVTATYEQLIAEGYIYAIERSGYFVEDIPKLLREAKINPEWNEILAEPKNHVQYKYSLSHMDTNIELFPYNEWRKNEQYAFKNHKWELSRIMERQGLLTVRRTIAQLISKYRDVTCEPEQIVLGVGTQSLVEQLLNILKDIDPISLGVEDPGYTRLYNQLDHLGIELNPITLDEKGISIEDLNKTESNIVFVTPSHQFPTGIIMPVSRRTELLNWAAKGFNRYIIEDDYDSEFKYKTDHIPSLHNLDRNDTVVYIGSFSKSLLPSLRISYMVLPKNLVIPYRKKYGHLIPENNTLSLLTLKYFIESGNYDRHIRRMTNYYDDIRSELISEIKKAFKSNVHMYDTLAGLHFTARFTTEKSYEDIEKDAKLNEIELYTIRRFMINTFKQERDITIIVGFGTVKKENIKRIVQLLYKTMMNLN